jgi:GH18 family chitinase
MISKIVGYFPDYRLNYKEQIQYDKLTHIMLFSLQPDPANLGNFALLPPDVLQGWQELVTKAHQFQVKVGITLGGWGKSAGFSEIATQEQLRQKFVQNIVNFVNTYQLDGVDMDWEYPSINEKDNFKALMQAFADQLRSQGKFLSMAGAAYGDNAQAKAESAALADFVNIMAYDGLDHGTMQQAEAALNYWLQYIPPEKAILGVPFYGRKGNDAKTYQELLEAGASPDQDEYQGYRYNGIPTIKRKTKYAKQKGGGIMIWEIAQDAEGENSLLNAIRTKYSEAATRGNLEL